MPVFRLLRLLFLSTPSARRATPRCLLSGYGFRISIHALREEGDVHNLSPFRFEMDFYPRPPRGGRLPQQLPRFIANQFLSTPSARRATFLYDGYFGLAGYFYPRPPRGGRPAFNPCRDFFCPISIHALREEGDPHHHKTGGQKPYFYPRPPRGGRLPILAQLASGNQISIHALREEGDPVR